MGTFWFNLGLTDEDREKLKKMAWLLGDKNWQPPKEEGDIEKPEEIGRLMRHRPHLHKKIK